MSNEGGDRGSLWYRYQLIRYQVPPTLKVLVPPILGAGATNIEQLIMNMTNSEMRSSSVPRETNGQDQTTPEHVTVASVSLSVLLKAKNSFYKFLLVPSHISLVPVPLPLVPGSTTFAQCCTRYHPSGTMVPLPCHPLSNGLPVTILAALFYNFCKVFSLVAPQHPQTEQQ